MALKTKPKWLRWFADRDTEQDRKLILKLDLLIVPYALLSYWTKYLDQANLSVYIHPAHSYEEGILISLHRQCIRLGSQGRSWLPRE